MQSALKHIKNYSTVVDISEYSVGRQDDWWTDGDFEGCGRGFTEILLPQNLPGLVQQNYEPHSNQDPLQHTCTATPLQYTAHMPSSVCACHLKTHSFTRIRPTQSRWSDERISNTAEWHLQRENGSTQRKTCPGAIPSTTNPIQTGLGLSPQSPRWEAMDLATEGLPCYIPGTETGRPTIMKISEVNFVTITRLVTWGPWDSLSV